MFDAITTVQDACSAVSIWQSEFEDWIAWLERRAEELASACRAMAPP